jgi:hypothetical protein
MMLNKRLLLRKAYVLANDSNVVGRNLCVIDAENVGLPTFEN